MMHDSDKTEMYLRREIEHLKAEKAQLIKQEQSAQRFATRQSTRADNAERMIREIDARNKKLILENDALKIKLQSLGVTYDKS